MGKHSQNGPTFTKAPHKKRRLADEERPVRPDPKIAEDEEKRLAAKKRRRLKLARTDPRAWLQESALLPKKD